MNHGANFIAPPPPPECNYLPVVAVNVDDGVPLVDEVELYLCEHVMEVDAITFDLCEGVFEVDVITFV